MTSMKTKTQLLKKKFKQPTEFNIDNYKAYINVYNSLKRKMKMKYYSNIIDENKYNMKKTWQTLRKVIGKTNNKSNFSVSFNIGNKTVTYKTEISKSLNEYFSSIGKQTSESVPSTVTKYMYSDFLASPQIHSMFLEPTNPTDILEVVNTFKPKTSCGHDEIPMTILKKSIFSIIITLTHIINKSFDKGRVTSWEQYRQVFDGMTPRLLCNCCLLEGDALNVTLLVPEARRATRTGLVGALIAEHYGSPAGRLADYRHQFEKTARKEGEDPSIFAISLETLAVKAFGNMGHIARLRRFIAGHNNCTLRRPLSGVGEPR